MQTPQKTLRDQGQMPGIGLGTFGSDRYGEEAVAAAVRTGIRLGYRLIDCASVYGNEAAVGRELARAIAEGIDRFELFVISKVWNDSHSPAAVRRAAEKSLRDLKLDHLDLYLIHWPFRNYHPKNAPPDYHNPDARPYRHEDYMETWQALEKLQKEGLVRYIGTSNMTVAKLRAICHDATILPAVNEMELHPTFQQPLLFDFCLRQKIVPIGYSPLGSPSRPARDRTPIDISDLEHPAVRELADRYDLHPAQVCLKWAVQRGQVPIPFSVKEDQLRKNLDVLHTPPFSQDDMRLLAAADSGNRLIKGQVFLWEGEEDWRALWR